MNNPSYYAILPANVRYDKNLKPMEKILYAEITALSNKDGYCSASNSYFAKLYEKSNETVSRWISHLEKEGYLKVIIDTKKGNLRKIYPIDKKINTLLTKKSRPIDENVKHNNINTILQENNKKPLKEKETKKENNLLKEETNNSQKLMNLIREFYKENNLSLTGNKVFQYERKLYELSKNYPLEKIEEVIKFAKEDDFYKRQLTNPNSLFNNFESMKLALKDKEYKRYKKHKSSNCNFLPEGHLLGNELFLPEGWVLWLKIYKEGLYQVL